ncbi:unnamed protein product [Clonostachys solani]|uniref:CHAT domain-containing protein n=1 Tax=Clonostachys solani TaxID=160281 RepID=A0A9N9YXB2_9HYPO|nr:unnamed protein product [Clonostachys solani]
MNREMKARAASEPIEGFLLEEMPFETDQTEAPDDCGVVQPFRVVGGGEHVDEATDCGQELTTSTPVNHPIHKTDYETYEELGRIFEVKYFISRQIAHLETAINYLQQAIDCKNVDDRDCESSLLLSLGGLHAAKFKRTAQPESLASAIQVFEKAILFTSDDEVLAIQAKVLLSFYSLQDADEMLRNQKVGSLASTIYMKGLRSQNISLMETCILLFESITEKKVPSLIWRNQVGFLGRAYFNVVFWGYGDSYDLDRSIGFLEYHIYLTPPSEEPDLAISHLALGKAYGFRFDINGASCDLKASRDHLKKSSDFMQGKTVYREERFICLREMYNRSLNMDVSNDLDQSITQYEEDICAVATDSTFFISLELFQKLAVGYGDRFHLCGAILDLNISIKHCEKILDLSVEYKHLQSWAKLSLALNYRQRFSRTEELADLEKSLFWMRDYMDPLLIQASEELPNLAKESLIWMRDYWDPVLIQAEVAIGALQIFGTLLRLRFEYLGNYKDIEESIRHYKGAASLAKGRNMHHQPSILLGLSKSYLSRYEDAKSTDDIDKALRCRMTAVALCPTDHTWFPVYLNSLRAVCSQKDDGNYYEADYKGLLKIAVNALQLADDLNRPEEASQLKFIGMQFCWEFVNDFHSLNLEIGIYMLEKAFKHPTTRVKSRVHVGCGLVACYIEAGRIPAAYSAAVKTLSLMPKLTPRSFEVSDKQSYLETAVGLASSVVGLALDVGDELYKVIQYLELGRGIILNSLGDLRLDIIDLQALHPKLAEEFTRLREKLDTPPGSASGRTNPRHYLSQKLEATIQKIRSFPGFDRFLLSSSEKDLKSAAARGPIVIINIDIRRCDALLIQPNQIRALELPGLKKKDIEAHAKLPDFDRNTLEWLWDVIVCPVLEDLGYLQSVDSASTSWPRIIWIPTGALSNLPLHAAGYHYHGSTNTVMDRAISSYSSSVRALIQSQHRTLISNSRPLGKAVLVGVQELKHAPKEIDELEKYVL